MSIKREINQCIYCRALPTEENKLTKEHVIPLALSGNRILEKATCDSCQKITSHFEQEVLSKDMAAFRHSMGVKTRNKKKRINSRFTLEIETPDDEIQEIEEFEKQQNEEFFFQ